MRSRDSAEAWAQRGSSTSAASGTRARLLYWASCQAASWRAMDSIRRSKKPRLYRDCALPCPADAAARISTVVWGVAQLGERRVRNAKVRSSILLISTKSMSRTVSQGPWKLRKPLGINALGLFSCPALSTVISHDPSSHCRNFCSNLRIRSVLTDKLLHGSSPHLIRRHAQGDQARGRPVPHQRWCWPLTASVGQRRLPRLAAGLHPPRQAQDREPGHVPCHRPKRRPPEGRGGQAAAQRRHRPQQRTAAAEADPLPSSARSNRWWTPGCAVPESFEAVAREWYAKQDNVVGA